MAIYHTIVVVMAIYHTIVAIEHHQEVVMRHIHQAFISEPRRHVLEVLGIHHMKIGDRNIQQPGDIGGDPVFDRLAAGLSWTDNEVLDEQGRRISPQCLSGSPIDSSFELRLIDSLEVEFSLPESLVVQI